MRVESYTYETETLDGSREVNVDRIFRNIEVQSIYGRWLTKQLKGGCKLEHVVNLGEGVILHYYSDPMDD